MINLFIDQFLTKINQYKKIALFVHHQPDFDAYASAFSLKQWINDNFPEKEVFLMIPPETFKDNEKFLFNSVDPVPPIKNIKDSIGIVLDTPTAERILTSLHIHCKELITIDHHPKIQSFAQLEFIDPTYPANSQILAEMFFFLEAHMKKTFKPESAQYLYSGILTDTNNLMSLRVSPNTYVIVSKLVLKGINRSLVHDSIFVQDIKQKMFNNHVLSKCKITNNGLSYSIITQKDLDKYQLKNQLNIVNNLENIMDVEVWCALIYDLDSKKWKCSLRSKEIPINNIAQQFGGGGHKNMAATVFEKKSDFYRLLITLDQYLAYSGFAGKTRMMTINSITLFKLWSFMFKFVMKDKYTN